MKVNIDARADVVSHDATLDWAVCFLVDEAGVDVVDKLAVAVVLLAAIAIGTTIAALAKAKAAAAVACSMAVADLSTRTTWALNAAIIASPALVAITGGRDTPDVVTVAAAPVQNRAVEFTWDCGFGVWRDDGAREGTANGVASAGDLVEL